MTTTDGDIERYLRLESQSVLNETLKALNLVRKQLNLIDGRTLLSYDGTVFDRLGYKLCLNSDKIENMDVLCATRPCMSSQLRKEVLEFAVKNGNTFVSFQGDCELDAGGQILEAKCSNVSESIKNYFSSEVGTLIIPSFLADFELDDFLKAIQNQNILNEVRPGLLNYNNTEVNYKWKTVFLFYGLSIRQFLYLLFIVTPDFYSQVEVPKCIVSCYDERMKDFIRHIFEKFMDLLTEITKPVRNQLIINVGQ
ncbi:MAG: hypothetical protein ABJO57_14905 [Lentilitoribacter sp.]